MPIADVPLGSYFGMFADKFGVQWMVDFDSKKQRTKVTKEKQRTANIGSIAWLDIVTSTICKHQQRFGLECVTRNRIVKSCFVIV
jgi:uncharacterized protein YcnI